MTIKLGNDYLVWIDSATPGTFAAIKGQGTFSESRQANTIDTSDKTTLGFNTSAPGNMTWTGSLDLKVSLPDVTGYTRMETVANTIPAAPVVMQIRKNGAGATGTDAIFVASVYWTIESRTFNKDGTVDVKVSLRLAAAPTTDTMA